MTAARANARAQSINEKTNGIKLLRFAGSDLANSELALNSVGRNCLKACQEVSVSVAARQSQEIAGLARYKQKQKITGVSKETEIKR